MPHPRAGADMSSEASLSERTVGAGQWRLATSLVQATLQLGLGVLLARLLPPRDFGIVALAWIAVGLAAMVSELGLGRALVRQRPLTRHHVDTAFTLSVASGMLMAALLWAAAPYTAALLGMAGLADVIRGLTLCFVFGGLGSVSRGLLQRAMDFRALFRIEVVSYAVGYGIVAVTLALAGHGVWALVWGTVAQAFLGAVLATRCVRHPLRLGVQRAALRDLTGFGSGAALNQLVNYGARSADNLLVGSLLGPGALGLYSRAYNLMMLPLSSMASAMGSALYPAMSEVQREPKRLGRAYLTAVQAAALASAPIMAGMAAAAPDLAVGVYGPAWEGMAVPLRILCLVGAFRAVYHVSGALTHAGGRVWAELARQLVYLALVVVAAVVGSSWGIAGVAGGVAVAITFMYLAMAGLSLRMVGRSWRDFAVAQLPAAALATLTGASVLGVSTLLHARGAEHLTVFVADMAVGAITLLLGLLLLPRALRPTDLFDRLAGSVGHLPAALRPPVARVLRLSA